MLFLKRHIGTFNIISFVQSTNAEKMQNEEFATHIRYTSDVRHYQLES